MSKPLITELKKNKEINLIEVQKDFDLDTMISTINVIAEKNLKELEKNEVFRSNFLNLLSFTYSLLYFKRKEKSEKPLPKINVKGSDLRSI